METDPDAINDADRKTKQVLWEQGKGYAADNAESKERNKSRADRREAVKGTGVNTNAFHTAAKHVKDMSPRERAQWLADYKLTLSVLASAQAELFPTEHLRSLKREEDRKAREAEEKAAAKAQAEADKAGSRSDPKSGGAGGAKGRAKAKNKGTAEVIQMPPNNNAPAKTAEEIAAEKAGNAAVLGAVAGVGGNGAPTGAGDGSGVKMQSPSDGDAFLAASIEKAKNGQLESQQAKSLEEREAAEGEAALRAMSPESQSAQAAAKRAEAGLN